MLQDDLIVLQDSINLFVLIILELNLRQISYEKHIAYEYTDTANLK